MGSFVSGPVIKFTGSFDEAGLLASVKTALGQVSAQVTAQNRQVAQQISTTIANPLIAQAAQLRALYSTGAISIKDLQVQQRALIGLLDQEISKLVTRNNLTTKELATLKQVTLERERQQNALNRGVGVGVTSGTQSALSLVSGPLIANISRLGTGLLGLAGGSGGAGGPIGGAFAGAASGITAIASAGGPAVAIIGALTVALIGAAGAAAGLAISGGALVQNLSNISQKTGITIQDLQVLQFAGRTVGVSLDDLVIGFRKFSQAVSGEGGPGETGDLPGAVNKTAEALKILGVTSKDPFTALEQLADAVSKLPDGFTKDAVVVQTLGRSALNLLPDLNKGAAGIEQYRAIVEKFGPSIDQNAIQSQKNWQVATGTLQEAFDKLKVSAIPVLDVLSSLTTESAKFLNALTIGNSDGLNSFEKVLFFLIGGSAGSATAVGTKIVKLLGADLDQAKTSAVSLGSALDKGFSIAENHVKTLSPNVKALTDLLNGTTEALQKLQEEGAKELQAVIGEQAKSATTKLDLFIKGGQLAGTNPEDPANKADAILAKQRADLEEIANIMLNLPDKAAQVAAAVIGVTNTTIADLEKLADESLKKVQENELAELNQQLESRKKIDDLIEAAQEQLAVDTVAASRNAVALIIAEEQKRYDADAKILAEQGANYQDFVNLKVALEADANAKIAKARQEEINKTNQEAEREAAQLFDALIKGGKNFTTAIKSSLENLLLTPVKQVFSAVVGGILTQPLQAGKDAITNFGLNLQKQNPTGILNTIGKSLAPGTAIGANTGALTINTTALTNLTAALTASTLGGGIGGGVGALNPLTGALPLGNVGAEIANLSGGVESLPLPLGNVTGELKNLTGVLVGNTSSGATSPNSLGSILGKLVGVLTGSQSASASGAGNVLFGGAGGAGGLIFHNQAGGGNNAALAKAFGPGLNLAAGFGNLISGIHTGNIAQALGGGASILGGGLQGIGQILGKNGVGATLGQVGGAIGGAGLVISGVSQGSLAGAGEAALGGAEIGTAIAPGIGTAIGAAAGFAAGLIGAIFGHHGFSQQQIANAIKKQTIDPNTFIGKEFDRVAEPTFAQTLATNFGTGPGGTFGNTSIPSAPPPPPPQPVVIQAMDAQSFVQFFQRNGNAIASTVGKLASSQVNTTQSGLARAVRVAVSPA